MDGSTPAARQNEQDQAWRDINHCPRILSLDSGGIRGLSSLLILKDIMDAIRRKSGNLKPMPCEYFDLVGGTSTGGLIAIMLGRLGMSVEECIEAYTSLAERVFKVDNVVAGVIPTGDDHCRFDAAILEEVMKELIEKRLGDTDARMADINLESSANDQKTFPTFIVATRAAAAEGPAVIFRSYNCGEDYDADECKIWEAAHCTSAAPAFFKPMFVRIPPRPGQWYLDGGLRHNNPAQLALEEAGRIWPAVSHFCLVSIGTGWQENIEFMSINDSQAPGPSKPNYYLQSFLSRIPGNMTASMVKNAPKGLIELKKIAECVVALSTSSEPIHQRLSDESNSRDLVKRFPYYRFNVERGMGSIGLQEWKAMVRIEELTARYMSEGDNERKKKMCTGILWKPPPAGRNGSVF